MSAMPSPKQCEILPPLKRSTTARAFRMADGEGDWFGREEPDWFASEEPLYRKPISRPRFLMIFFLGAVATLAWQSYGNAAREAIAGLAPQLQWLAPQDGAVDTDPDGIGQIRRSIDRIASDIATSQKQITRSIDHLAAGQEQMTTEIVRLRAITELAPLKGQDSPQHRRRSSQAR